MAKAQGNIEHQIISIEEYLRFLNQYSMYQQKGQLFYRAQLASYESITPSIARGKYSKRYESGIVHSLAHQKRTAFQSIAWGQHNGYPTRFIDFTTDPLVALFFALDDGRREDSIVYVFIQQSDACDSPHANMLVRMAQSEASTIEDFKMCLEQESNLRYSVEQIREWLRTPVFIKRNSISDGDNVRMKHQCGTFAIAGNELNNGKIGKIKGIDEGNRFIAISIPFEYKEKLRKQLDERHITREFIYPGDSSKHMPQFCAAKLPIEKSAVPYEERIVPKSFHTQYSVKIALNGLYTLEEIKNFALLLANERSEEKIVIWFARDSDSVENCNWVLMFQLMRKDIPMFHLEQGVQFTEQDGYVPMADFYKSPILQHYEQKIPVSEHGLSVTFTLSGTTKRLVLTTNLYAGAQLRISSSELISDYTVLVNESGETVTDIMLRPQTTQGTIEITLPSRNLQSANFISQAGIQYENLNGIHVHRDRIIGPIVQARFSFKVSGDKLVFSLIG